MIERQKNVFDESFFRKPVEIKLDSPNFASIQEKHHWNYGYGSEDEGTGGWTVIHEYNKGGRRATIFKAENAVILRLDFLPCDPVRRRQRILTSTPANTNY